MIVERLLANRGVVICKSSYSPDLAPADFFYSQVKIALKGKRFQDFKIIKKNIAVEHSAVSLCSLDNFHVSLEKLSVLRSWNIALKEIKQFYTSISYVTFLTDRRTKLF
jgi:hypothetical protein